MLLTYILFGRRGNTFGNEFEELKDEPELCVENK